MDSYRGRMLMLLLFFMFFMPTNGPTKMLSPQEKERLNSFMDLCVDMVDSLNASTRQTKWADYKHMPPVTFLDPIKNSVDHLWNTESGVKSPAYYRNVSAIVQGLWRLNSDVKLTKINMTSAITNQTILDNSLELNSPEGSLDLHITEWLDAARYLDSDVTGPNNDLGGVDDSLPFNRPSQNVSMVVARLTLETPQHSIEKSMKGIQIIDQGNMVFSTSSVKFPGSYSLPHFLPSTVSDPLFEEAKKLVLFNQDQAVQAALKDPDYSYYSRSSELAESCEYIVYLHTYSTGLTVEELEQVEAEIYDPLGRPHRGFPPLKADITVYSPDCGVLYQSTEMVRGEFYELRDRRVRFTMMAAAFLILLQTISMAYQMKDTSTPSMISRISFYSMSLMALADGAVGLFSLMASVAGAVSLSYTALASLAGALTMLFDLRYMMHVYQSQVQESIADARAAAARPNIVANADGRLAERANGDSDSLPTTNSPPATAVAEDESQTDGAIYSRYYVILVLLLLLSVTASTWSQQIRRVYEFIVCIMLFSIWIPQIVRNIRRGTRRSFLWSFVIVSSVTRLLPVLYLCLDEDNVMEHHYDPYLAIVISAWLWIQICLLAAQAAFGPRFFLPKSYGAAFYNYHPVIFEEDLEAGFSFANDVESHIVRTTGGPSTDETDEEHQKLLPERAQVDCAICMMPVELVIVPKGSTQLATSAANMVARSKYMVTPCRHVFHTTCMETWMRTRLQCPVCRNPLPPI